jgi:hypothetical protein
VFVCTLDPGSVISDQVCFALVRDRALLQRRFCCRITAMVRYGESATRSPTISGSCCPCRFTSPPGMVVSPPESTLLMRGAGDCMCFCASASGDTPPHISDLRPARM